MRRLHYHRVDVFTDRAFGGNPLAVFTNGRGLNVETMQAIAKEFNLSETTIVLEEGVGPVPVRVEFKDGEPAFAEMTQPPPRFGPRLTDARAAAEMLSLDAGDINAELPIEVVSCGVPFLFVPLRGLDAARRARPRAELIERAAGGSLPPEVFVFTREVEREGSTVHSRMFAPGIGITEDPATGGASGPLGCYLVRYGLVACDTSATIVSEQGIEMGRPSFIKIRIERSGDQITAVRVGGECHFMGEGFIEI